MRRPLPPERRWAVWAAGAWLLGLVAVGLLAPWLPLPYTPATPDLANLTAAPGQATAHYLGTDPLGRDVLAQLVFGTRQLLLLSLPAAALAIVAAALLGGAAGYWGNRGLRLPWLVSLGMGVAAWAWLQPPLLAGLGVALLLLALARYHRWWLPVPLDSLVLSGTALLGTLPRLVLVLAFAAGPPLAGGWLLALLALLAWPDMALLVRTHMRQLRVQPYIEAARAAGLPEWRIWWRHALPAACRPLGAYAPLILAGLIGLESTLAFLGIGVAPDAASWGQLLSQFRQATEAWWLLLLPGGLLLTTMLALQLLARYWAK